MPAIEFTKMHGIGNDFIVVDAYTKSLPSGDLSELAKRLNDRKFGIGGDGLILVMRGESAPFRMRMLNPDGSEAEMCGNGIRCVARFVRDRGLTDQSQIPIETGAGLLELGLRDDSNVRVNMGKAHTNRGAIPMTGPKDEEAIGFEIEAAGKTFTGTAVSMGNPHVVIFVSDVKAVPLEQWGSAVENHSMFPNRTNVHFVQVVSNERLIQRTWERGAGATLACGTGACAVLVAAYLNGHTGRHATVQLPGGELEIEYEESGTVFMTGPAEFVFDGVWETN
jgi:diaminopimelate epimerase